MSRSPASRLLLAAPVVALGLMASAPAQAADAVVAPLIAKGVDPLIVLNMTSLLSSELDFMGQYGFVDQIETMPPTLNSRCLSSGSCLGQIAQANDATVIVTGAVSLVGNKFDLYLVLVEDGMVVRSIEKTVPNIPMVVADSMGGIVKELITGVSQQKEAADADLGGMVVADADIFDEEEDVEIDFPSNNDDFGDDDFSDMEFDLDDGEPMREPERYREPEPEPEPVRYREPEPEPQEEIMFAPVKEDEMTVEDFSFGSAASEIVVGDDRDEEPAVVDDFDGYDDDNEDSYSRNSSSYDDRSSSRSRTSSYDRYDEDDEDDWDSEDRTSSRSRYDDEPATTRGRSNSRSRYDDLDDSSSRSSRSSSSSDDSTTSVAGRVGLSRFQSLNFVTYGAEVSIEVADNIALAGGIEAYASRREIPPALLEAGDPTTQWDTILPFNLGAQYRLGADMVRPYVGADLVFIPGYVQEAGGMAVGFRARLGLDLMVADNAGLNINGSAGYWSGSEFETVARDMTSSGGVPQLSAGTVFRF